MESLGRSNPVRKKPASDRIHKAFSVVVWTAIASLGVSWLYYTWLADPREWLETSDQLGGIIAGASVIWALASFLTFARRARLAEQKASRYQAWQIINTAQGKPGNGGRLDAVADLARDGISLAGVNLDGAFLHRLAVPPFTDLSDSSFRTVGEIRAVLRAATLCNADFTRARMEGVDLSEANLLNAVFVAADLSGAKLHLANATNAMFHGACFDGANLTETVLVKATLLEGSLAGTAMRFARLQDADMRRCVLRDADLKSADLRGANLAQADLTGASLRSANLEGAILTGVVWNPESTDVAGARLFGVRDAPLGFLDWACLNGATAEKGSGPS